MKGIPGCIFYHQIYYKDRGDEVAYCADCDAELLTDDNEDEAHLFLCPECWDLIYPGTVEWREATKDGEHNPPKWVYDYSAHYIIRQGSGNWENVKYRTEIAGTVDEIDRLQTVLRSMPDRSASSLIKIIEASIVTHEKRSTQ